MLETKSIAKAQEDVGLSLLERGYGDLKDYASGSVRIVWGNMPPGYFHIRKGKVDIVLNKQELQYLLRNV